MDDPDEAKLVRLAKGGDQQALDGLIRLHQGRVRAFLGVRLHDPAQVDDLAQDALVIACNRLSTFDETMPFYPWLRGIAHNVLRQYLRKPRPGRGDPQDLAALIDAAAEAEADCADHSGYETALRACLERVTGTSARTLRAHYFDARPLADIAKEQGRTAKAVGVMLVRTRQWLKRCIEMRQQGQVVP